MTSLILAQALGRGVEVAALTPYAKFSELLRTRETIGDTVLDAVSGNSATYEVMAVQQFEESSGPSIEVRVLASDGFNQVSAYLYVLPGGADPAS